MPRLLLLVLIVLLGALTGCGTIKGRTATEQLLVSDAVDQSVDQIDFTPLASEDVFLDVRFLKAVRGVGFVNSEYIISSIRQRMITANCRLTDSATEAKYIVEVRVGALGSDCHEVNYGVPGSQALNQTASLMSNAPLPSVPEISLARTDSCRAAAKISLFAYERESREPIWESGTAQGISLAKSTWILGAGPFQEGDIYEKSEEMQTIELPEIHDPQLRQSMFASIKNRRRLFRRRQTVECPTLVAAETNHPQLSRVPTPESSGVRQASAEESINPDADVDADLVASASGLATTETGN